MERKQIHKALLGVELYKISGTFIHELRLEHNKPETVFQFLPEYTINTNKTANNQPIVAKYFHQFVGILPEEKNNEYIYFNLITIDPILADEISSVGIEELFKKTDFQKILSHFTPHTGNDIKNFIFPEINYLIVEIEYNFIYDYYSGVYDGDTNINIVGYLDPNLQPTYFK